MKPRYVIVMLVVLALVVPALMLAQQSKAEKEVLAVVDELTKANLKGGPEVVPIFDKYLADDFVRIPGNGAIFTKADMLDGWRTGKIKVEKLELSDVKVHVNGNTAVVTGIFNTVSTVIGTSYANTNRWTRVFVKRGGVWQCVLYQTTPIAPASAQAAPQNAPPSYVSDPAVYKLVSENDQFRVIMVTKAAGQRDAWHSHLANTVYDLTDCHQRTYTPDGQTRESDRPAGSVYLQPAIPSHSAENIGTAECRQLIVERK